MAKMQIPLNGSNYISKDRLQSFQDALADDHQVKSDAGSELTVAPQDPPAKEPYRPAPHHPAGQDREISSFSQESQVDQRPNINLALNHTYNHQQRTLEIHQQYISQQAEYIQLITAVLDQQGQALKQQDGQTASSMIDTFQRTLDNFHSLREQGVEVHREFLNQQTAFLERYLIAIENGHQPAEMLSHPAPAPAKKVTEWVVQQPPIVLDEQTRKQGQNPANGGELEKAQPETAAQPENLTGITLDALTTSLLEIVAEKTGYPAEMLELDMDLEADLGIDSIKRVEILGSLEEKHPELPPADADVLSQTRTLQEIIDYMGSAAVSSAAPSQPVPAAAAELELVQSPGVQAETSADPQSVPTNAFPDLTPILLDIVAEKTGYPAEMLELDMDLEADLGIDSIKRVEILGSMEERVPGLPPVPAETLAELRTLAQIVSLMSAAEQIPAGSPAQEKKKAERSSIENTPVDLVALPWPDRLDFTIPEGRPIILTDDGTDLSVQVSAILEEQGWKTIIWQFPDQLSPNGRPERDGTAPRVKQAAPGAAAIQETLASLRADHGSPAGFIHLHPLFKTAELFSAQEEDLIKEVFFMAGALQEDLTQIDPNSRNLFLSIIRLDGALGLSNQQDFQVGAGLTGLVKSLSWEWPGVFCRAIDFDQGLSGTEIGQLLSAEIQDPNLGLPEVGISLKKRVTIRRSHGDQ